MTIINEITVRIIKNARNGESIRSLASKIGFAYSAVYRWIAELEKYRNGQVAIVCHTDKRSAKAANILRQTGFNAITVIRGGMKQWHRNGMPVER